jgi:hypothetical protein
MRAALHRCTPAMLPGTLASLITDTSLRQCGLPVGRLDALPDEMFNPVARRLPVSESVTFPHEAPDPLPHEAVGRVREQQNATRNPLLRAEPRTHQLDSPVRVPVTSRIRRARCVLRRAGACVMHIPNQRTGATQTGVLARRSCRCIRRRLIALLGAGKPCF